MAGTLPMALLAFVAVLASVWPPAGEPAANR